MINLGATQGLYRYGVPIDVIVRRAIGTLASRALHHPVIDKETFHRVHWRYLRACRFVIYRGDSRFYRARVIAAKPLFLLTPEDLE